MALMKRYIEGRWRRPFLDGHKSKYAAQEGGGGGEDVTLPLVIEQKFAYSAC
jgi:hypothetical protein